MGGTVTIYLLQQTPKKKFNHMAKNTQTAAQKKIQEIEADLRPWKEATHKLMEKHGKYFIGMTFYRRIGTTEIIVAPAIDLDKINAESV